jgi:hypothetical protein
MGASGGLTLSLLVSATISFFAYGVLFGSRDQLFLYGMGLRGAALYAERGLRLFLLGLVVSVGLTLPYLAAGLDPARPLGVGLASASASVAAALLAYARAAASVSSGGRSSLGAGMRDPELATVAALVYAPLLPLLAGTLAGTAAGLVERSGPLSVAAMMIATISVFVGARWFEPAAPRFLPRASEITFTPPAEGRGEKFRLGRGLSAFLPRRSAAVWVRDATLAGRRFTWAARSTWLVAVVSIAALARWGDGPSTRSWVLAAVGLALLIQSLAVVGVGLVERNGRRWLDRSLGIGPPHRFVGRCSWAWGMSHWLLVPVGLARTVRGGSRDDAWLWPLAGLGTAIIATTVSLLNASRE